MADFTCEFGFLKESFEIPSGPISILPVREHSERLSYLKQQVVSDFIYCPIVSTGVLDRDTGTFNKLPGTERGSDMLRMPASHTLTISGCTEDDPKRGAAAFLVHFIAFIYGTRLQFSDWWVDGKVPFKNRQGTDVGVMDSDVKEIVKAACLKWSSLPSNEMRAAFTNALFFHGKMLSTDWEWEKFLIEYIVFDALWFATGLKSRFGDVKHKERLRRAASEYRLCVIEERFKELVDLRNDLFHQCIWAERMPGEAGKSMSVAYAPWHLRRFNSVLILSFVTETEALESYNWTSLGGPLIFFDRNTSTWRGPGLL